MNVRPSSLPSISVLVYRNPSVCQRTIFPIGPAQKISVTKITCGCSLFEWGTFLRRMDNFLMDIYADPEDVEALIEQLMVRHMATLEKVC